MALRVVFLVSGSGSNLQAVMDAVTAGELPIQIIAVGADRPGTYALERATAAGLETFVVDFAAFSQRSEWDAALLAQVNTYQPDLVVSSGFMRLVGSGFIACFERRFLNTHPALLPAFPGAHGVRDALDYGVKITGCTVMYADSGVDTGPIIAQRAVEVLDNDTEASLHERIKVAERELLIQVLKSLAVKESL